MKKDAIRIEIVVKARTVFGAVFAASAAIFAFDMLVALSEKPLGDLVDKLTELKITREEK